MVQWKLNKLTQSLRVRMISFSGILWGEDGCQLEGYSFLPNTLFYREKKNGFSLAVFWVEFKKNIKKQQAKAKTTRKNINLSNPSTIFRTAICMYAIQWIQKSYPNMENKRQKKEKRKSARKKLSIDSGIVSQCKMLYFSISMGSGWWLVEIFFFQISLSKRGRESECLQKKFQYFLIAYLDKINYLLQYQ